MTDLVMPAEKAGLLVVMSLMEDDGLLVIVPTQSRQGFAWKFTEAGRAWAIERECGGIADAVTVFARDHGGLPVPPASRIVPRRAMSA